MKKRDKNIDILKGIGIILIVLGHTSFPYSSFLYLFHVVIFIIASGYFWSEKNVSNLSDLKKFIINKVKKLYVPYVICNSICVLLNNFLININVFSLDSHKYFDFKDIIFGITKSLLFNNETELFGALWFLRLLFTVTIVFAVIEFLLKKFFQKKKNIIQIFISVIFLIIGYYMSQKGINLKLVDNSMFMCYPMFLFGIYVKKIDIKRINDFVLMILTFSLLLILNKTGKIELSLNIYTNIIYFLLVSILGWLYIYSLSSLVGKVRYLDKILQFIGENSMHILTYHFIVFKFVNLLLILILKDSVSLISAFPTLYKGNFIWIIYTFFGIILSIFIGKILNFIKINLKKGGV